VIASFTAGANRVTALFGRLSMYRLVQLALGVLAAIAFVLSFAGLVVPTPWELLATALVLVVVGVLADTTAQRLLRLPLRTESTLITSVILLFVLRPTVEPMGLVGIAIAALAASVSKYLLAWRGRHIFNPAAVGATVVTIVSALLAAGFGHRRFGLVGGNPRACRSGAAARAHRALAHRVRSASSGSSSWSPSPST